MSQNAINYELPPKIEQCLAALSRLYLQQGKDELNKVIVNATVRVHEGWSSNNWNGGTYGHALYLTLPEELFVHVAHTKESIAKELTADLNAICSVQNEYIEEIFFEMEVPVDRDWRAESGLLATGLRAVLPVAHDRIWKKGSYRLFMSHKAETKREVAQIKEALSAFGISGFVAHQDIHPTKEWQDEIENALFSMDALVAFMTGDFKASNWTDQEVGFALGRGVPVIPIKMGCNPYGFIGKIQALQCGWDEAPLEIVRLLSNKPRFIDCYLGAVERCETYDKGNVLSKVLPWLTALNDQQASRLSVAYRDNGQLQGSFGFSGSKVSQFGNGLIYHLNRLGFDKNGEHQKGAA